MSLSGKRTVLFGGKAESVLTDRAFGVVHPKHPDFAERIRQLKTACGADTIVAQKLAFNTKITDLVSARDQIDDSVAATMGVPGFLRTKDATDGIVIPAGIDVERGRMAALLMVGDSGTVKILAPDGRLVVLNLSLECLHHKDGSSIVTNAIEHLRAGGIDPADLELHIGEAAMTCCYGHDPAHVQHGAANAARAAVLQSRWGADVIRTTTHAPRKGWDGIDMPLIAARQAEALGVDVSRIVIDPMCTSHEGLTQPDIDLGNVQGTYFSALRGAPANVPPGWNGRGAILTQGTL